MPAELHHLGATRLIDTNGIADAASIYFYLTGTLTPAATYTDEALADEHPHPIPVASGAAVPTIYLDSTVNYRRRIVYADGSVDDTDPYTAPRQLFFQSGTGAVSRAAQDKLRETVSVLDFIPVAEHAAIAAGTSETDLVDYFNLALATGNNVRVPEPGTYMVDTTPQDTAGGDCIHPLSNQKLIIEKGATIQALPSARETYYVIDIRDVENVTIEGGGKIKGERSSHIGTTGESGMCIAIYNSSNITIRDVTCQDAWGDGIYAGGTGTTGQSSNVLIDNVICTNNRRNNLSIIAVDGCIVRGGSFTDAGGADGVTGAMCGIDVEPNDGKGAVNNVLLDSVTCTGNDGPGISAGKPLSTNVTIRDAQCTSNDGSGLNSGKVGPGFKVFGGSFNGNAGYGIHIFGDASTVVMGPLIDGVEAKENTLDGIFIGASVLGFDVLNFKTSLNGRHGVRCERVDIDGSPLGTYCDEGLVRGESWDNSQTTTATYDNIHIGTGTHYITVENCRVRRNKPTSIVGSVTTIPTNQPRYGINSVANEYNTIRDCDVTEGGVTAKMVIQPNNIVRGNLGFKTENRVLSSGFNVETAGVKSVTIPHGCAYTPSTHHCQYSIIGPSGYTYDMDKMQLRSVDATNVTIDVDVRTGTGVAGQTAFLALSVERPSPL